MNEILFAFYVFSGYTYPMETTEQTLKKRVQIVVVVCLSVFFVLVTVVVFQFAIRINQSDREKTLARQNEALKRQIEKAQGDIEYFESDEFKEDYALRYLNKGKPGDKVFS